MHPTELSATQVEQQVYRKDRWEEESIGDNSRDTMAIYSRCDNYRLSSTTSAELPSRSVSRSTLLTLPWLTLPNPGGVSSVLRS